MGNSVAMIDLDKIFRHFQLEGDVIECAPFGNGHINSTFRLITESDASPNYLLQRINHSIFTNVPALMDNIFRVSQHIEKKLTLEERRQGQCMLTTVNTVKGTLFHKDESGDFWRVFNFLDGLKSYEVAESCDQIFEVAKSFGRFLNHLSDFPADSLHVTIKNFHDILFRLDQLKDAMILDVKGRKKYVTKELSYIFDISSELSNVEHLKRQRKIPIRVTHSDTKLNNALLGPDNQGKCVIDLDTVMPGIVHYDFGDGIRTTVSMSQEDEINLSDIFVDLERFEAFTAGYLSMTRDLLTPMELHYLPLAGPLLSYIMAVRFLTDYLCGDIYYKISHDEQNLQRAKSQLELTRKILLRLEDMTDLISKHSKKASAVALNDTRLTHCEKTE